MAEFERGHVAVAVAASTSIRRTPKWVVITLACLFAGLLPETILTSSTSVAKIVGNPFAAVFVAAFYGTAMLLIRDLRLRKPASWVTVILLGIAFGFCNEGVVAGTWYTVVNRGYQMVGPVDVTWAVALTAFHVYFSILLTIVCTDVLFPSYAGVPLLGRRGTRVTAVVFVLLTALFALTPTFRGYRLLVFASAWLLVLIATRLPKSRERMPATKAPPRLWALRIAGFCALLVYFVAIYLIPAVLGSVPHLSLGVAQIIDCAVILGVGVFALWRGLAWRRRHGWGLQHDLALLTGVVMFATLLTLLVPTQRAVLEPAATLPFLLFLIWRAHQLGRQADQSSQSRQAQQTVESATALSRLGE